MNDRDRIAITQIAATDFPNGSNGNNDDVFNKMAASSGDKPITVGTLVSGQEVKAQIPNELLDWKIVGVYDTDNERNGWEAEGVVAYIMVDNNNNATIAFRGTSQDYEWAQDTDLLNSTITQHQQGIQNFLNNYKTQLEGYNSISLTGHSLGGNDATFAALELARMNMADKIDSVYSMDGPGFSQEFLSAYAPEIEQIISKIHHRRWSLVGSLLNPIPGADNIYIGTTTYNLYDGDTSNLFTKHDTKYVEYDENGNMISREPDLLARWFGDLSRQLDAENSGFGNAVRDFLSGAIISVFKLKETMFDENGLTIQGYALTTLIVLTVVALFIAAPAVLVTILGAVAVLLAFVYYEVILEALTTIVSALWQACVWAAQQLASFVATVIEWAKKIISAIVDFFKGITDWVVGKARDCLATIGEFISGSIDWVNEQARNAYHAAVGIAEDAIETTVRVSTQARAAMIDMALQSWLWTEATVGAVIDMAGHSIDSFAAMFSPITALPSSGTPGISMPFIGMILRYRDFSQARKQELVNISQHFSHSGFWQSPEQFWRRAEYLASGACPEAGDFFVAKTYAHAAAESNQYAIQRIEMVFREAYAADSECASRMEAETRAIRQTARALNAVANSIGTFDSSPGRVAFA
jgi:hypothetical protein